MLSCLMVTYIKGNAFVLIKTFSIIFQVSVDRFFSVFFKYLKITKLSMKCAKKDYGVTELV